MDEEYKMGGAVLGITTQQQDLGVTFSADMNVSEQCGIAASKGNQILGLIRRNVMYKEKQLNCTPVQINSYTAFGILYSCMEAIS